MRWRWLGLLVLAAAAAGCMSESGESYELRGTFTEEATQEQRNELASEIEERGGQMAELESFPVQFHATGLEEAGCEEVRSFAQEADYVREVGNCHVDEDGAGGDEATSNDS